MNRSSTLARSSSLRGQERRFQSEGGFPKEPRHTGGDEGLRPEMALHYVRFLVLSTFYSSIYLVIWLDFVYFFDAFEENYWFILKKRSCLYFASL